MRTRVVNTLVLVALVGLTFALIWADGGLTTAARFIVLLVVMFAPVIGFAVLLNAILSPAAQARPWKAGMLLLATLGVSGVLLLFFLPRSVYRAALGLPLTLIVISTVWRVCLARRRKAT